MFPLLPYTATSPIISVAISFSMTSTSATSPYAPTMHLVTPVIAAYLRVRETAIQNMIIALVTLPSRRRLQSGRSWSIRFDVITRSDSSASDFAASAPRLLGTPAFAVSLGKAVGAPFTVTGISASPIIYPTAQSAGFPLLGKILIPVLGVPALMVIGCLLCRYVKTRSASGQPASPDFPFAVALAQEDNIAQVVELTPIDSSIQNELTQSGSPVTATQLVFATLISGATPISSAIQGSGQSVVL